MINEPIQLKRTRRYVVEETARLELSRDDIEWFKSINRLDDSDLGAFINKLWDYALRVKATVEVTTEPVHDEDMLEPDYELTNFTNNPIS